MKPVTQNHTVINGVTKVTDNTNKKPVPQPVQRRSRQQRQAQGGCKTCGQRR